MCTKKDLIHLVINVGLVLYWFGHAPGEWLGDGHGDVIIKGWKAPAEFMLPTGDIMR